MRVTNQITIHEKIMSTLNSRNACYHSLQNLLSSYLLSQNLNIKIYIIIHKEELHYLHASQIIIRVIKRRMNWARHTAHMGEMRNAYKILVGNPEGKRPLGRPRCRQRIFPLAE
jgi:hypothetical protein